MIFNQKNKTLAFIYNHLIKAATPLSNLYKYANNVKWSGSASEVNIFEEYIFNCEFNITLTCLSSFIFALNHMILIQNIFISLPGSSGL
jgi:hypothetical protein